MGGLWQMGGLRKEIDSKEEDVCGFVGIMGMVHMVGFD